jgi:hypothetical protein
MPKYYHRRGTLPNSAHKYLKYKVVIYYNQKPKKILYKSRTIYPAREKYRQYLADNNPYFPKKWDWLGKPVKYELLLLGNWGEVLDKYESPAGVVYTVNRKAKDGFVIKAISPYYIEEKFKYYNKQKMITFKDIIKLMVNEKYSKMIMSLNNKVLIEIVEKDELHLFILKNRDDAMRLYETIKQFYHLNKISDCLFLMKPPRGCELNELYTRICKQVGISRTELKKQSTRA